MDINGNKKNNYYFNLIKGRCNMKVERVSNFRFKKYNKSIIIVILVVSIIFVGVRFISLDSQYKKKYQISINYEKKYNSLLNKYVLAEPYKELYIDTDKILQASKQELYHDILCSLLLPSVEKSVGDYYTQFLTDIPLVDPWDIKILSEEKPNNAYAFAIKMQVSPYLGPHLDVGFDNITLTVQGNGDIKVINFEHISSSYLELPPGYQNSIKKNLLPN